MHVDISIQLWKEEIATSCEIRLRSINVNDNRINTFNCPIQNKIYHKVYPNVITENKTKFTAVNGIPLITFEFQIICKIILFTYVEILFYYIQS